jgi:hypothetical protein
MAVTFPVRPFARRFRSSHQSAAAYFWLSVMHITHHSALELTLNSSVRNQGLAAAAHFRGAAFDLRRNMVNAALPAFFASHPVRRRHVGRAGPDLTVTAAHFIDPEGANP